MMPASRNIRICVLAVALAASFAFFAINAFDLQIPSVLAETNSWSGRYQSCVREGSSGGCNVTYLAILPSNDRFQAWKGTVSGAFEGHGGFGGGGGGEMNVDGCLSDSWAMWQGNTPSCVPLCRLDVNDDWGRCDVSHDIGNDPNPDMNYWTLSVWVDDGTWHDPVLGIQGRRVSIDSFDAPSSVNAGESFTVSWDTDQAMSSVFMFIGGPVNEDDTSLSEDGSIDLTTTGPGTVDLTLKACGPGGSGSTCVEQDLTVDVEAGGNRHLECVSNTCTVVQGQGNDECFPAGSSCGTPAGRFKCQGSSCVFDANDSGPDQCTSDANCAPSPTHFECDSSRSCVEVSGAGRNDCSSDSDCVPSGSHHVCRNNSSCVVVSGPGSEECSRDSDCVPPATHRECQGNSCVIVSGSGSDGCTTNANCVPNPTHKECQSQSCVTVSGSGSDDCTTNANCAPSPTHKECQSQSCVTVSGSGPNECTNNASCAPPPTHRECSNFECRVVSGPGPNECGREEDCWPPPPDCGSSGLTATPDRIVIPPRRNVSLNWNCSVTQGSCSISPTPGSVNHSGPATVAPEQTTTYTLTCSDRWGRSTSDDALVRVFNYVGGRLKEVRP